MASAPDTPYAQTALDYDTRGWIMSGISGAGMVDPLRYTEVIAD